MKGSGLEYAAVLVCSLVVVSLGASTASLAGNVVHVRHGREPNAASSLFPTIPLVPAFYVGVTWLLNQWHDDLGVWIVVTLLLLLMPFQVWTLRKLESQLRSLDTSNVSKVPDESPIVE